jgi:hypothetical protein
LVKSTGAARDKLCNDAGNPDHKDHNYSSMLPFIDRLFGTFYLPKAWPRDYGTSTPVPETLIGQFAGPARADRRGPRPIASPVLDPGLTELGTQQALP